MTLSGELTILLDYKLSCEYREVCLRKEHLEKARRTREEVGRVLDMLEALAEPVMVRMRHWPLSPDADDDMVFDVAINGGADAIVTFNIRDFRAVAAAFRLEIMTPAELLDEIRRR